MGESLLALVGVSCRPIPGVTKVGKGTPTPIIIALTITRNLRKIKTH